MLFNPLEPIMDESSVEHGLENRFRLESIGLKSDQELSTVDDAILEEFKQSIQFIDNKYRVNLPWYPDRVACVPSNSHIALSVLHSPLRPGAEHTIHFYFLNSVKTTQSDLNEI